MGGPPPPPPPPPPPGSHRSPRAPPSLAPSRSSSLASFKRAGVPLRCYLRTRHAAGNYASAIEKPAPPRRSSEQAQKHYSQWFRL